MRKLIMTRGLPGSGKSTWALQERESLWKMDYGVVISCKDDIRAKLEQNGWAWSPQNEKQVIKMQNDEIISAFHRFPDNCVVIVADTNFGKHEARLRGIAQSQKVVFEIEDFTDVPIETCIERDAKREKPVGEKVIREMAAKYISSEPVIVPYTPPEKNVRWALICDLDGTLALHNGKRSPYDYSKVDLDDLNEPIASIVSTFGLQKHYVVLYVSGRDDSCRDLTLSWLKKHWMTTGSMEWELLMRKTGDQRRDDIVKLEIFNQRIRDYYNVKFVLDDRDRVVKMWRALGLATLQVNYGAF